ncbi:MAG TPA: beta-ketoacyl-[acyl-carrier-protein] synthase family protein [Alphaproteobacteria bacterium]|nr:beta-ketoacyl-[acyl-carrier-protein] synthase family protein [Alphaproteobacteria bacterium]
MRRVAITGMGVLSCIGLSCQEVLASLQQGRSGIEFIPERKSLGFRSAIGGRIKGLGPPNVPKRNLRQMGPGSYFAVHAAMQALEQAGLRPEQLQHERVGIVIGNIGNMQDVYRQCHIFHEGTQRLGGTAYQKVMTDSVSANLSVLFGTKGYSFTVSAACATGAVAIGQAAQLIRAGLQDVCICGGVQEDSWEYFCQFDALQVVSMREDEPTKASRPFDEHRDGFVPSAGCGIVVLEELEAARRRGATIYAELIGYSFASDGYDMTAPSGEGSVRCMEQALRDAGVAADRIDYINAHATSTPIGDVMEAQAIAKVFGSGPYVSSTKSMTGHEQGTSGSNELIYTLLMMTHNFVAPSINLEKLDARCAEINLVANHAIEANIDIAASNSFGFGGVNTCILIKKYSQ